MPLQTLRQLRALYFFESKLSESLCLLVRVDSRRSGTRLTHQTAATSRFCANRQNTLPPLVLLTFPLHLGPQTVSSVGPIFDTETVNWWACLLLIIDSGVLLDTTVGLTSLELSVHDKHDENAGHHHTLCMHACGSRYQAVVVVVIVGEEQPKTINNVFCMNKYLGNTVWSAATTERLRQMWDGSLIFRFVWHSLK
ncbi:hypothetical protein DFJ73DRAFT_834803 [Zopfochytrium polystomum]|nr:hypothetical protein DFJ73DRAFT_834803 [Zopfochytrium polystomum]